MSYSTIQRLLESELRTMEDFIEEAKMTADRIKSKCGPWLSESKNGILYRGEKYLSKASWVSTTRAVHADRYPRNSSREAHELMNAAIKHTGLTANRSNSLFATRDPVMARSYTDDWNQVARVFPVGNFNYTWSEVYQDALDVVETLTRDYNDDVPASQMVRELPADHIAKAMKFRGDDGTLQQAIEKRHEVMIHADRVLLVNAFACVAFVDPMLNGTFNKQQAAQLYDEMMQGKLGRYPNSYIEGYDG